MNTNKFLLIKKRQIEFRRLTGLTIEKFDELLEKLRPIYKIADAKRLFSNKQLIEDKRQPLQMKADRAKRIDSEYKRNRQTQCNI